MERFKTLTRRVLAVSNKQVKEEEKRFSTANANRRKRRGK
jgi:hypothetical protein